MKALFAIFSVIILIAFPAEAAVKVYRCEGKVQQYPCSMDLFGEKKKLKKPLFHASLAPVATRSLLQEPRAQLARSSSTAFARVLSQVGKRIGRQEGHWQGKVEGNGQVQILIEWFRDGTFQHAVPLGSVTLQNRSTNFGFRTSWPEGNGWTWKVSATAKDA
jgi:hypothetical protein